MPINKYGQIEFLRGGDHNWVFDFTEAFKKMKEREEYDSIWELIKKKNNW